MKSNQSTIRRNRFIQSWAMIAITMLAFILLCLSLNSFANYQRGTDSYGKK